MSNMSVINLAQFCAYKVRMKRLSLIFLDIGMQINEKNWYWCLRRCLAR